MEDGQRTLRLGAEVQDVAVEAWVDEWGADHALDASVVSSIVRLVWAGRYAVGDAAQCGLEVRLAREGAMCQVGLYAGDVALVSSSLRVATWSDGTVQPDLRSVNEALLRQKAALRRSNEDLERFAAAAAHDLKAPLGVIRTYGTVLSRIYAGESSQRYADGILSASARLTGMLDGMLRWARIDGARDVRRYEMQPVVDEVLENLKPRFEGVDIQVELGRLPPLALARFHTVQVFQNLVDNAIKYRRGDSVVIRVDGDRVGEWVQYTVTDNGRGIPDDKRTDVFELFHRLKRDDAESGAGIGLALVTRIVERYSGEISVSSAAEHGSTFCLRLPYAQDGHPSS